MHTQQAVPTEPSRSENCDTEAGLAGRRRQVVQLTGQWCHRWFDAEGRWIDTANPLNAYMAQWGLCFGLLTGMPEDRLLANAILGQLEFEHHMPRPEPAAALFDIFVTNHAVQMLAVHGHHLTGPVRAKLEGWAREALKDFPGDHQCDYQFHGYNDNMPAMATLGLILGGEYFGDSAAVEHGLWNLRQLRDLLTRRGLLSEYTSPTYSPLSLINLVEVMLHARHPEARQLAGQCVQRIWADVLGHFHVPTGLMGGPYSRAYQQDSIGHISTMACLLWLVLGSEAFVNPVAELQREPIRLLHHHNWRASQLGKLAWVASCDLRPPADLLQWVRDRRFPFHLVATAERGEGFGAGEVLTTHYAEEDFALGTAENESWTQIQAQTLFLQYRRRAPARGMEDVRTLYMQYLIDQQHPSDQEHWLRNYGNVHTVQEGRVAMALVRPVLKLANQPVTALKLSLILPTHFGGLEKIELRHGQVFIQDGPLYLGLRPLNATDWGRDQAVSLENVENYQVISFYNYRGGPRAFSENELIRTLNGVVVVVGLRSEESFEAFINRVSAAEVLDYSHQDNRTVRYRLGELHLGMSYGLKCDCTRFTTINGKPVSRPIWQADGLPAERLPFLDDDHQPNSLELPYQHLKILWSPDSPWTIASVGQRRAES